MIKKILSITIFVFLISSCDMMLSFWASPVFNVPALRVGWTVDSVNYRIIVDSEDNNSDELPLWWDGLANTLLLRDYYGDSNLPPTGFPEEMSEYNDVKSPLFYLSLLFKNEIAQDVGIQIDIGVPYVGLSNNISIGNHGDEEIRVDYTIDVTTTIAPLSSYTLPEPAYLGVAGSGSTTELIGSLHVVEFNISSTNSFVRGQATCVFSSSNPAGLLYMVYYHNSGLVSLVYAHDVETTETGNYFPDGHYEYIWSVYRPK